MLKELYQTIYDLFEKADSGITATVGNITLRYYRPEKEHVDWSEIGVTANGTVYTPDSCLQFGCEAPRTFAQLFAGEHDVIQSLAEHICSDWAKK